MSVIVSVDCVVFGFDEGDLKVLLIRRGGEWALPGGFVRDEESLDDAALRVLHEDTGIDRLYLEQLYTFGDPERSPRRRVISVAYYALVKLADYRIAAAHVAWFAVTDLPSLAFDHAAILDVGVKRLRAKVRYQPVGFELLPTKFTLSQLQHLYEVALESKLDKRNFRKKILGTGLLLELDEREQDVAHRAARLYRFDARKYRQLARRGFNFEI